MIKGKRGFFQQLSSMGIFVVIFAVIIVVGTVVLANLNSSIGCSGVTDGGATTTYNQSNGRCHNGTAATAGVTATASAVTGYALQGYMGTTNGGLGSWTTAVIALGIGVLFIGALAGGFMRRKV